MENKATLHKDYATQCPHCHVYAKFYSDAESVFYPRTKPVKRSDGSWSLAAELLCVFCSNCHEPMVELLRTAFSQEQGKPLQTVVKDAKLIYPFAPVLRKSPPQEVPSEHRRDYVEAAAIESLSPRMAAVALRRCLQNVLTSKGFHGRDLVDQLAKAIEASDLPSALHESLDMLRLVGNYGAHPIPVAPGADTSLEVEPGELDMLFGALDDLFDHYYVKPLRLDQRKASLNAKLQAAGKPLIGQTLAERAAKHKK
jgi:hypothetical protein